MKQHAIRFVTIITTLILISINGQTEEVTEPAQTGWIISMVTDLTATQTSYSDSWAGGEAGSISWVSNLNGTVEKVFSPKFNFKSILRSSFGQTSTQNADTKKWSKPKKSTDLLDWDNVGRFTLGSFVDPYVAIRVETQFFDGSVDAKKRYLNPMKLTESVGSAHEFYKKGKESIVSRFGFGIRQLFVTSIIDTALLTTESVTTNDGGIEFVTDATLKLNDNIQYLGKLTIFKALFSSESDTFKGTDAENYWKAVDVNWESTFSASITKIITINFYSQLLYDKQKSLNGRFKETLGVGFLFRMI